MRTVELSVCTLTFLEEDIAHAHFHDGLTAGAADVDELFDAIHRSRGEHKTLLVVSFGDGADMDNEARAHAASDAGSHLIAADAIVVRDFGHQMRANVFVRVNKPKRPIQLFPDMDSALAWLREQRTLIDQA